MPFINTKVNVSISPEQEEQLKSKLGKAISIIPGKSERWLMLNFEDNCRMYFRGNSDIPTAFIEVKIFGGAGDNEYDMLTSTITGIVSDVLKISPDQIYIKYEEVEYWGYNGHNF
ncbi:MAG: phenylpyruvate tautomerase MIF-related protein [Acutalibacteraceae bacterium]